MQNNNFSFHFHKNAKCQRCQLCELRENSMETRYEKAPWKFELSLKEYEPKKAEFILSICPRICRQIPMRNIFFHILKQFKPFKRFEFSVDLKIWKKISFLTWLFFLSKEPIPWVFD